MFQLYARMPGEATPDALEAMVRMVVQGGAVTEEAVRTGIPRARALVFCATQGRVIGAAALKVPVPGYRAGLAGAHKSGVALEAASYPLELGYVAVDPRWRGNGIGPLLCSQAIALAAGQGLFATTGDDMMRHRILPRLAFHEAGRSWQGRAEPVFLMLRPAGGQ